MDRYMDPGENSEVIRENAPLHHPFSVNFKNVSYDAPRGGWDVLKRAPSRLRILEDVSGHVSPGESLAILGPSGAGKSTLLNLIAARTRDPPSSGTILFSGRPRVPRLKRYVGYVTQDDVFLAKLTVRETLMFTAEVRLPRSIGRTERVARVERLLKRLGLGKCADTIVGDEIDRGISGGERKRLNIANELVHEPSLFLADECTSGLDSTSALNVLNVLEGLCNDGRTVIVTIHQPSSRMFDMFGKILLLAAGRVAYFGKPDGIVHHFSQVLDYPFPAAAYNPADYALELVIDEQKQGRIIDAWRNVEQSKTSSGMNGDSTNISDENIAEICDNNEQSNRSKTTDVQIYDGTPPSNHAHRMTRAVTKRAGQVAGLFRRGGDEDHNERNRIQQHKYHTSWWDQTSALMKRATRQKQGLLLRGTTITQVVVITILAVFLWLRTPTTEAHIEDRLGLLNFQIVTWMYFGLYASVFSFPEERTVLQKDRSNGIYRLSAYYVAKSLVELPADMLYPALSATMIYFPAGMNPDGRAFVLNVVVLLLHTLIAHSVGLFVSCALMDVRQAQVAGGMWALVSLMASGYIIDPLNIPSALQFVRRVSFLRYGYESLIRIEFGYGRKYDCVDEAELKTIYSGNGKWCPVDLAAFFRGAGMNEALPIWAGILVQCLWIATLRLLAYFSLKLLHTTHKPRLSSWKAE